MLDKIKQLKNNNDPKQLFDLRTIGLVVFVTILLLVSWSGVKVIGSNYELQKQISALEQENRIRQLENNNLTLENQYLNTDQYLELSARAHFNKAAPGEKLLTVPRSVALEHSIDIPQQQTKRAVTSSQPSYERNFNAWLNFFFHREG